MKRLSALAVVAVLAPLTARASDQKPPVGVAATLAPQDVASMKAELASLWTAVETLKKSVDALAKANADLSTRVQALTTQLAATDTFARSHRHDVDVGKVAIPSLHLSPGTLIAFCAPPSPCGSTGAPKAQAP